MTKETKTPAELLNEVISEVKAGNQKAEDGMKSLQAEIDELKKKGDLDEKTKVTITALEKSVEELKSFGERVEAIELAIKRVGKIQPEKGKSVVDEKRAQYDAEFIGYARGKKGKDDMIDFEKKTLQTNVDPDGGVLVTNFIESEMSRVARNSVSMRGICNVKTISKRRSYVRKVKIGGSTCRWEGEGEQNTANTNTPQFAKLEIVPGKIVAKPLVTEEMMDDTDENVEAMLVEETGGDFADTEATAFVSGNGVEKPKGFLTYDTVANASWAWNKIGYTVSGVSGGFAAVTGGTSSPADNIIDLIAALPNKYLPNAVFIANKATIAAIRKFKDTTSNFIWQDSLQKGTPPLLFGYPVIEVSDMPDIGANAFAVAFGDFRSAYIIVDKTGMRVIRDEFSKKPDTEFCFTKRVGGGVHLFDAVKLLKLGTS